MSTEDLITQAFNNINAFKRHRALELTDPLEDRNKHKLAQYEYIDKLELTLRAIQKKQRIETTQVKERS